MFFAQSYVSAFDAMPPAGAPVEFDPGCAPLAIRVSALCGTFPQCSSYLLLLYPSRHLFCPPCSRYPEKLGKYWLGPIDPTRPHDEPQGGYGLVKAGINSETGERVCCKLSHLEYEGTEAQRLEIVLQAGLKHVNVVDLKDIVFEKPAGRPRKQLCLIMELQGGGELFSEVVDQGGFGEGKARFYFRQILEGMAYCHARKLVHRDLKLENLLLTGDRQFVKIADFGLAKNVSEDAAKTVIGTAKYAAPEMLAGAAYDGFKSDMWSCGVCLYAMTECRFPFTKAGNDGGGGGGHGVHQTTAGNLRLMRDLQDEKYELKPERSPEYVAFLKRLLCPDVATRYSAAEALMDPWIMGDDWSVEEVQAKVAALDSSSVVVPTGYAQSEWVEQVKRVMTAKDEDFHEDEPEMQDGEDEEEDEF